MGTFAFLAAVLTLMAVGAYYILKQRPPDE